MQPLHKMETHHALTLKGGGPYELYETYWVRWDIYSIFFCFSVEGLHLNEHSTTSYSSPRGRETKYLNGEFQKCTTYLIMFHGTHSSWDLPGSWESVLCVALSVHLEVCSREGSPGMASLPVLEVGAKFNYRIKDYQVHSPLNVNMYSRISFVTVTRQILSILININQINHEIKKPKGLTHTRKQSRILTMKFV